VRFDDHPPPVAAWVVLLDVIDELERSEGGPTTPVVGLELQRRTEGRLGRHLTHVSAMLRQLEREGALERSRPTARATLAWRLTEQGRWFLRTARRAVSLALRRNFKRRGGKQHGGSERQRR
jgi:DNA-binding MarR family transcriptional regulator